MSDLTGVKIETIYTFCKRHDISLPKSPRGGQNVKNLSGATFGSLTVLHRDGSHKKLATWRCQCKCGKTVTCLGTDLRQGKTKTCGCKIGINNRRNWRGYGDIPRTYWSALVHNAEQRGIQFELEISDAQELWVNQEGICKLSGMPISLQDSTASVDRICNSLGYQKNNIQWVHKDINKMKSVFTQDEFIKLCQAVTNHQKEKTNNVTTRPKRQRANRVSSALQNRTSKKLSI